MLSQAQQKALMRKYSGSQLRSTAKRPLQRQLTAKSAAQAADPPLLQDEHPLKSATAKQRQELVSWDAAKVQNFLPQRACLKPAGMETLSLQQDHRSLQTGNYSAEQQQAYCVYKNYQHGYLAFDQSKNSALQQREGHSACGTRASTIIAESNAPVLGESHVHYRTGILLGSWAVACNELAASMTKIKALWDLIPICDSGRHSRAKGNQGKLSEIIPKTYFPVVPVGLKETGSVKDDSARRRAQNGVNFLRLHRDLLLQTGIVASLSCLAVLLCAVENMFPHLVSMFASLPAVC